MAKSQEPAALRRGYKERAAEGISKIENRKSQIENGPPAHFLTFDVEEYFHVEAAAAAVPASAWESYSSRLEPCIDSILAMLAEHDTRSTFFVLGWVARRQPEVVKKIASAGHEIASHGMSHRMLGKLSPVELVGELADSRKLLEDISGRAVAGFRAPTFSITRDTAGALDALLAAGYTYDSSIFPVRHDRYGVPDAPPQAHWAAGPSGGAIMEIPPLTLRLRGANWPVGGGGYLRLFPVGIIGHALRKWQSLGRPGMIYVHPWEIDPGQPVLPMSRLSRWRHRVGLTRTEKKLRWLLENFQFTTVCDAMPALSAAATERFSYS